MAKHISSLCSCAVFVSVVTFISCNRSHHNCSSALPLVNFSDTLRLFPTQKHYRLGELNSGMVLMPAGQFIMGAVNEDSSALDDEFPPHHVQVDSFWIDVTEVTNAQFRDFVQATGYMTTAERTEPPGSLVFTPSSSDDKDLSWWKFVEGADWQHPLGPASAIDTMDNHPVVHVSWFDAMAYASWAGKRLPTEAEWEYAARSGVQRDVFPWGNTDPEKAWLANVYQGSFPKFNTAKDGYLLTSPVKSYLASSKGIYDVSGNVWEWCSDNYHSLYYSFCVNNGIVRPGGPSKAFTPENRFDDLKVIRGGSFLCNKSYCTGYRVSARNKTTPSTSLLNVGFRCVRTANQ